MAKVLRDREDKHLVPIPPLQTPYLPALIALICHAILNQIYVNEGHTQQKLVLVTRPEQALVSIRKEQRNRKTPSLPGKTNAQNVGKSKILTNQSDRPTSMVEIHGLCVWACTYVPFSCSTRLQLSLPPLFFSFLSSHVRETQLILCAKFTFFPPFSRSLGRFFLFPSPGRARPVAPRSLPDRHQAQTTRAGAAMITCLARLAGNPSHTASCSCSTAVSSEPATPPFCAPRRASYIAASGFHEFFPHDDSQRAT